MYARRAVSDPAALEAQRARYDTIFEAVQPPFAFLDLDAMRANADAVLAQANGLPIRIASKSVRSLPVLRRIFELSDGFRGILSFTLPEALWLAGEGFDDIVIAYPTADRDAVRELVALAAADPARAPVPMVDDAPHLDLIEGAMGAGQAEVRVCMDVDAGWWPLGGRLARIGPKRSPIHEAERAGRFAAEIAARPGTSLAGVMSYEGQIAGVGDDVEGEALRSAAVRWMQSRSERDLRERLPRVLEAVKMATPEGLDFVNAGGTGSLARTAAAGVATELTAGSGFYAPHLFDNYRSLDLEPAAFFVLPIVRRPSPGTVTALGGGYLASGPADELRLPKPHLPDGLRLDGQEGAGEVQTPLLGTAARQLRIGDRVYMRHAKAGELCERFASLYLLEGDSIVDEVPTYRGAGKTFL
jgi:D-serine deaminase-like pyridoxal phosphate-dependent protein